MHHLNALGNNAYQWFELSSISPESIGSGLEKPGHILIDLLIISLKRQKFLMRKYFCFFLTRNNDGSISFVSKKSKCAGIMGYSGLLFNDENFNFSIKSNPIRLYHGKNDDVITFEQTINASQKLNP